MYRKPARILEATGLKAGSLMETVETAFAETSTGEGFILVTDQNVEGVCLHLLARQDGRFTWSPLSLGPSEWRIEITRRDDSHGMETLEEAFSFDHDRIRSLSKTLTDAASSGTIDDTAELFGYLNLGLHLHLEAEEKLLFPDFKFVAHLRYGPLTEVLTDQHGVVLRDLEEIQTAITALKENGADNKAGKSQREEIEYLVSHMGLTLESHFEKEETSLLPISDQLLPKEKTRHILSSVKLAAAST